MKQSEIKVGGHYTAKVSGKIVTVRVDSIGETERRKKDYWGKVTRRCTTHYNVTNLATGRELTFQSAQKFRQDATD